MTASTALSNREFSELIGAIYDCALDPEAWPTTCRRIAALCDSDGGGICVHDARHTGNDQLFVFGYRPEFLEGLGRHYAQSPMAAADIVSDLGHVRALSQDRAQLVESRFYQQVLAPFGLEDIVWFPALRTAGRMASLHASRTGRAPLYQESDLALFRLLAPHVCRSLAISDTLDIRALKSEILEKTLDGLAVGVFLAARDGRILYMNPAAERQVRAGAAIALVDSRLHPTDARARDALAQALADAGGAVAGADAHNHSVAIPGAGGNGGYVATLLSVDSGRRQGILAPFAASVAVFMQDPVQAPMVPGEAFARLHGLTGSELRVLMALAQGLNGLDAAEMLGISEPTLRTHLQRTYSKTGTSGQVALMKLLHHSTPPLRSAEARLDA